MEDAFIVQGGKALRGKVILSGAKNVALKAIIAALLFDSKVILENVPRINDVFELLHLIGKLGVKVNFIDKNVLQIDSSGLKKNKVDLLHASKIRVSFLLFAPLLHRFGKCLIPNPGGCRIGERPIDRIISGMRGLGVSAEYDSNTGYYKAQMKEKPQGTYAFEKSTHTGTELLLLLSVLGRGVIELQNTAEEPEIDQLIDFLNKAGARIKRNKRTMRIEGVKKLVQTKPFRIMSDRNEAITFAVLGIASHGDVVVKPIVPDLIAEFIKKVKQAGGGFELINGNSLRFFYKSPLKPVDIETSIYPGFMTDWQPNWAVLMTQAKGVSIIHERVFENRFSYMRELKKLGARMEFVDPEEKDPKSFYFFNYNPRKKYQQAIKIRGELPLHSGVLKIADLRAGASLAIASLIAQGESIITGASILERGYEDFTDKISKIGGEIQKT